MKSYIEQSKSNPGEITMRLYGEIGGAIDGNRFAEDFAMVANDCEIIKLHINSVGGDVFQGMSIVSAMLSIDTPIHVYVDGVAASMAAVIAVCGDKIIMADYAKMMIHDPYFPGAKALTAKQKKMCDKVRDMLNQVLTRRGISSEKMTKMMEDETWLSASEATDLGLCDEVSSSLKNSMDDLTPLQLLTKINEEYELIKYQNQNKMKLNAKLIAVLCLAAEPTEIEINAAIEKLVDEKTTSEKKASDAIAAKNSAEKELKEFKEKRAAELEIQASAMINGAVKLGRLAASGIDTLKGVFALDFAKGEALIAALPEPQAIHSKINSGGKVDQTLCAMSWEELDKKGLLPKLKAQFPDEFKTKFNAKFHPEQE